MTIRRLFPVILVCFLSILAVSTAPDPDMWWHLRTGERILAHGIPSADPYSYTVTGAPWLPHEWLSDVVMWVVWRSAGFTGLNLLFASVVVGAFLISYASCAGRPYVACLVVSLATLVAFFTIGIRPQMFNLLFLATFILVLERYRDAAAHSALWLLPVLTAVWANVHSGFMLGVAVLLTYAVGETVRRWFEVDDPRGLDAAGIRRVALTAAACLVAALANPHGYRIYAYSFETLGARYVANGWVIEWASPDMHSVTGWPFIAMLALGALGWAFSPRRASVTDVLLFTGTAAAGLYSARHMALFAIAGAPVVCRALVECVDGTEFHAELVGAAPAPIATPLRRAHYWAVAVGMVVLAVVHGQYNLRLFESATTGRFPVAAVDFIATHDLAGRRVFNTYGWGGYLIWRGIPVFIDGRADVYGDAFIAECVKANFVQQDWREPLDRYGVEYALVERECRLRTVMLASGEWREVYGDRIASVLVRAEGR